MIRDFLKRNGKKVRKADSLSNHCFPDLLYVKTLTVVGFFFQRCFIGKFRLGIGLLRASVFTQHYVTPDHRICF